MGFAHTYTNTHRNKIRLCFDTNLPIEKCSSSWSFQQSINANWVLVIVLSLVFKNLPYPNLEKYPLKSQISCLCSEQANKSMVLFPIFKYLYFGFKEFETIGISQYCA